MYLSEAPMNTPWIQVSVDTQDVPNALRETAYAVEIGAEWIEVGTPLLTFAGIGAIADVSSAADGRTVVADFKALDGVAQYFKRAGELGAGVATVMAVANEASILKAIETGRENGVKIQVDLLGVPTHKLAARAKDLAAAGADYFLLHLAIDELLRNSEADPLEGLDEVVAATNVPVGPVVFSNEQGVEAVRRGASYVVIGYPFMGMEDPQRLLAGFADAVRNAGSR